METVYGKRVKAMQTMRRCKGLAATRLRDGRVLITGGLSGGQAVKDTHLWNPKTGQWSRGPDLLGERAFHSLVPLSRGRILVVGGVTESSWRETPPAIAEVYEPRRNAFRAIPSPPLKSVVGVVPVGSGEAVVLGLRDSSDEVALRWRSSKERWERLTPPSPFFRVARARIQAFKGGRLFVLPRRRGEIERRALLWSPHRTPVGRWETLPSTPDYRGATLALDFLPDGRVVALGSRTGHILDLAAKRWEALPSLGQEHLYAAGAVLHSGEVLVVAGFNSLISEGGQREDFRGQRRLSRAYLTAVEIWRPDAPEAWQTGAPLREARSHPVATRLADDSVLVTGGYYKEWGQGLAGRGRTIWGTSDRRSLRTVECCRPGGPCWESAPPLHYGRFGHSATLLPDGRLVVIGGGTGAAHAEIRDPRTGQWRLGDTLHTRRVFHTATRLRDNRILVTGGFPPLHQYVRPLDDVEIWDPSSETFVVAAPMNRRRGRHTAAALPDGRVLVVGSTGSTGDTGAEVWDPATNRWTPTPGVPFFPAGAHALTLPDGRVLVVRAQDAAIWSPDP